MVVYQLADRASQRVRCAERDEDAAIVGEKFLRIPEGRRDHSLTQRDGIGQRTRDDLRLIRIGGQIDVASREMVQKFVQREVSVDKADMVSHPQFACESDEAGTIALALVTAETRMGRADDHVKDLGVIAHQRGHRADRCFDPFAGPEQTESHQQCSIREPQIVFRHRRVEERPIRNAMRNYGDLLGRNTIDVLQYLSALVGHGDQSRGERNNFVHDPALRGIRRRQDRVQCRDHGNV